MLVFTYSVYVFVMIFLPRLPPQNLFTLSEFTLWPFLTAFYFIFRFDSLSRGDESSFTVAVSPLHHITRRIFFFFFPLPFRLHCLNCIQPGSSSSSSFCLLVRRCLARPFVIGPDDLFLFNFSLIIFHPNRLSKM